MGPIPKSEREIQTWLEGLLSKQCDTEETAVLAVEEYRDEVLAVLDAEMRIAPPLAFEPLRRLRAAIAPR